MTKRGSLLCISLLCLFSRDCYAELQMKLVMLVSSIITIILAQVSANNIHMRSLYISTCKSSPLTNFIWYLPV
ncbi:hypothetical protein F5B20DRAFT_526963 [Whalleya microplaca]|nr:hypothetical protein F5B20DRAFT_526963 [Whalleya microplaca]